MAWLRPLGAAAEYITCRVANPRFLRDFARPGSSSSRRRDSIAATPGDFQALGRNVLLSLGKLIGLMMLGGMSAIAAAVVYVQTASPPLAVLATAPVLLAGGVVLVPLVALAYQRFDVGRDTPA